VRGALFLLDLLCRDLGTVNGCLVGCFTGNRENSLLGSRSKARVAKICFLLKIDGFFCDATFTNCAIISGKVVGGLNEECL